MKIRLLLLICLFSTFSYAQTFDWSSVSYSGTNFVRQTIGSLQATCTNSSNTVTVLNAGGYAGSNGNAIVSSGNVTSFTVTFSEAIDVQSIFAFDGNTDTAADWTFTPTGGINANVVQNIAISTGSTVQVNWTNVSSFTITSSSGTDRFSIDDIVFSIPAVCNVNIPDTNFKNYLVANTAINTNGDTEIQCSEASAFNGAIYCNSLSISDLTGIEAFAALTKLYCYDNQLTSLDVSNNTALTHLTCYSNQISSLDLSNHTALTYLNYSDNQISSLDLSNNTALIYLFCNDNQISNLDLSNNPNVIKLSCTTNQLTSLNLSANTALSDLNCSVNQLTNLDISANTALTKLYFANNQITSLDLSAHTVLEHLFCNDNLLTSLNVANTNNANMQNMYALNNPYLSCIEVDDVSYSDTNWTDVDAVSSFSLDCSVCTVNIPDANFKAYLVGNAAINTNGDTEIQCSEATAFTGLINVAYHTVSSLVGIEAFVNLTELYCSNNALTSIDVSANTALTLLHCNSNLLTNLNVSANTLLTELYCNGNNLTSLDVSGNADLVTLWCQFNDLTSLNVANGNNTNFTAMKLIATNNQYLNCIQVDDAAYSDANWPDKDSGTSYSEDCSTLSVSDFSHETVSLYPNPTSSILNIKMKNTLKQATVYSVLGAKVLDTTSKSLNTANLKSGLYLITIEDENGSIATKRFMKK